MGQKRYELADHLGNVRAVLTDAQQGLDGRNGGAVPTLAAYYNYYAFGLTQPGRFAPGNTSSQGGYRYGFNGQEKDDELDGIGNSMAYTERMYDTRLVRWKSLDGAADMYPALSPYAYIGNSPNYLVEKDGHIIGTLIGAAIGAYKAHKEGTSIWKGAGKVP